MIDFIRKNEKRILIISVIAYLVLWIFVFDSEALWTSVFLPLFIAAGLFVYERIFAKTEKERISYYDLKEFANHKPFSIDSLREVFKDEKPEGNFALPAILSCELRGETKEKISQGHGSKTGSQALRAPLTDTECIAYRVVCGCVKPRDLAARRRSAKMLKNKNALPGFSFMLFTFQDNLRLSLRDEDDSIAIDGSGIFNFSQVTEKTISWSSMSELSTGLRDKIDNELKLQKIALKDYTGIIIREQLIKDGAATVYGTCKKSKDGITIGGSDIIDDPGGLYITNVSDSDRKDTIKNLSRSLLARRLVIFPAIALLLGIASFASVRDFYSELGIVRYEASTHPRKLSIKTASDNESMSWFFEAQTDKSLTLLTAPSKKEYKITKDAIVTLSNVTEENSDYIVGKDLAVSWEGSYWGLKLTGDLPKKTNVPYQKGKIYIKNKTDKKFSIRFDRQVTTEYDTYTWEWTARLGNDSDNGTYAIIYLHDKQGKTTGEKEVILETGDSVNLSYADKEIAKLFLGYSSEIKFLPALGWSYAITDQDSASRHTRLYVKNTSGKDYRIEVYTRNEKKKYDTWWDFEAGHTYTNDQGEYLASGDSDAAIDPGDVIHLTQKNEIRIYEGTLAGYRQAKYNFFDREWKILAGE